MTALVPMIILGAVIFGLLWWAMQRPRAASAQRFSHDFELLKADQSALEAQVSSGHILEDDAQAIRNDLRRRVLALSKLSQNAVSLQDKPVPLALGFAALILMVFAGVYAAGQSGVPARGVAATVKAAGQRANLPSDTTFETLMAEGQTRFAAGNAAGAFDAYEAASKAAPGRVEGWLAQGEALVVAGKGEVSPAAMLAFARAEQISPGNPVSLYYSGLERLQQGDAAAAQSIWQALKARSRVTAPWMAQLERGLVAAAQALGEEQEPQIGLAEIEGMVAGLAAKLEADPNDPQGWLMLARSNIVLGRPSEAQAALRQLETLSDVPDTVAEQARILKDHLAQK